MTRFTTLAFLAAALCGGAEGRAGQIEIPSILIKLIEQVDVPAREAGVLVAVTAREGQMVEQGEQLARISDVEARLTLARAKMEVEVAAKKAENDVNIRYAKKSVAVAEAELRRSMESIEEYPKSISDSELDRLRLTVDRAVLEIEQAQKELDIVRTTLRIKENEYQFAAEKVLRRKILAPISGVVVQVERHRGEWVEPGDMVLRILRMDRLRAEGFLSIQHLPEDVAGRAVKLIVELPGNTTAEFPGKIVFLSPEIDPVNAQVRVWAEIENRDLQLRPGMRATMTIEANSTDPAPEH